MEKFLLDTNILIHLVRNSKLANKIVEEQELLTPDKILLISVVTLAEAEAFARKLDWGEKKIRILRSLLNKLRIIDINSEDKELISAYAEIDSFSQSKTKTNPSRQSPRNMGKNDLWIAATALASNSILITTDADFDHLNKEYLTVLKYTVN